MINGLTTLSTLIQKKVNSEQYAGRCVTCLAATAQHGLCPPCRDDLPNNRWHCLMCALPLPFPTPDSQCGECKASPPPFSRSLIPWRYQHPVDGMIGRYKYSGQHKFARPLLAGLADYLDAQLAPTHRPDVLIPAPMHWLRRWQRGFNQAQDIAEAAARRLDLPVNAQLVKRQKRVRAQRTLDRTNRLANLRGLFTVVGPVPPRVAIVDDVVTTGATVRELASVLIDAGAQDVQVWALARTPG